VLTRYTGSEYILGTIGLEFREGLEPGEGEQAAARLDRTVNEWYAMVKRIFIDAESAEEQRTADFVDAPQASAELPEYVNW
jgi:hypothetical protein